MMLVNELSLTWTFNFLFLSSLHINGSVLLFRCLRLDVKVDLVLGIVRCSN